MVRRDRKWHIVLLALDGARVTGIEEKSSTYHRDLAEDEARKLARSLGK